MVRRRTSLTLTPSSPLFRMYNALTGLGGAGQVDTTAQNRAAEGLHSCFAVVGFVVGIAHNQM